MTDHQNPAARICPDCDGFASVAVTLGGRNRLGFLNTITAHCKRCEGTGTLPPLRTLVDAAATAAFAGGAK
ncbi:hypothetical protein H9Y04_18945 [Streptomyces sp. TRM66268-LWL]|uniref:Uncharacterized protein n=1 Tax=Streptomyces polyasparticus TaxID=2767826 RepID=A0ABR7SIG7_9ACTN|nr:hypothetical protein [Streptomyces polyasparticus]MBC9714639.1 hypothetical protein [Streptomyces polyasparticus]